MERPRAHVIEDESEHIFRSLLPKEWIVRKVQKDYGVDYEVEIVEGDVVTGNRVWFQLKGTDSVTVRRHRFRVPGGLRHGVGGRKYVNVKYIAFETDTKLLKYSLRCDFPLLLGIVDIPRKDVYWIAIRDEIECNLESKVPKWKGQHSVTVYIPMNNSFSQERNRNYYGLRWYAMEPTRTKEFASLYYSMPLHPIASLRYEIKYKKLRSVDEIKNYLGKVLKSDNIFGESTLLDPTDTKLIKSAIKAGVKACKALHEYVAEGKKPSGVKISKLIDSVLTSLLYTKSIFWDYQMSRRSFLFPQEPIYTTGTCTTAEEFASAYMGWMKGFRFISTK